MGGDPGKGLSQNRRDKEALQARQWLLACAFTLPPRCLLGCKVVYKAERSNLAPKSRTFTGGCEGYTSGLAGHMLLAETNCLAQMLPDQRLVSSLKYAGIKLQGYCTPVARPR